MGNIVALKVPLTGDPIGFHVHIMINDQRQQDAEEFLSRLVPQGFFGRRSQEVQVTPFVVDEAGEFALQLNLARRQQ